MHTIPFTRELPLEHRFELPMFDDALCSLMRCIEQRMSAALISPSGTGKTTLGRWLVDKLPQARHQVHYVKVTSLNKRDMCREIASAMGCSPAGTYPALVRTLQQRFVETSDTDGLRPVIILDESHDMRPDVLAMLRILTNFDMDSRLVVSILLIGQPPLRDMLRRDCLESLARRLAHIAVLQPLSREQTARYIEHRCLVAGAAKSPFDPRACDAIYEVARGNLRATDHLALKAMLLAVDDGINTIDTTLIVRARALLWP
jgi:type II secretory pathway predicted ATPase ExeA